MRNVFFTGVISLFCLLSKAQTSVVEYSKDFEFTEGIYLEFKNFIRNQPVPKSKIITDLNRDDIDFMHQLTSQKVIKYVDSAGNEQSTAPEKLWGYSKNNGIFIYYENNFCRISLIGTLCHFTATITRYGSGMGYGFGFGGIGMGTGTTVSQELRQFMIDTYSGSIYDFTVENLELILQTDPVLLLEYKALKKKEKRESTFLYLRKYNQRHPLYFPTH